MNKLLIYTESGPNRLRYIFDIVLSDLLGLEYELTHNKDAFVEHTGPKFSYCKKQLDNEMFFESANLLFQTNIENQPLAFSQYENIEGFYPVHEEVSALPFDIFASAFFIVSRYKEYLPGKLDKYDRFRASQSMNYKLGYLEKPEVNYYSLELKQILSAKFPELSFVKIPFTYTATFDIDMAYAYKHKGLKKNIGGIIRSFLFSDFKDVRQRIAVLTGKKPDPFDTFDFIFNTCNNYNIPTKFFFLLGDESRFDKNTKHTVPAFRALVKNIADKTDTGIHLSFRSHVASSIMRKEIKRLEDISGKKVTSNRFHYLRFQIPFSYQRLIKLGITEDYSMGYAPHIGFRSGLCIPHYFFDVRKNEVTNLKVYPFAFMDATFTHYYNCDPEYAIEKIRALMRHVKYTGGHFMGLWHNSSFTEQDEWKGWREIFETVAEQASIIMTEQ